MNPARRALPPTETSAESTHLIDLVIHRLLILALIASPLLGGEAASSFDAARDTDREAAREAAAHDFHVSYGRLAVEGTSIAVRFRFFSDDLQQAIRAYTGDETTSITDDPASWAPFESYLTERFHLVVDEDTLQAALIGSGEDIMDKEPVRWFLVQFDAATPVRSIRLNNSLLFETFDDQKNIVQFRHFPSEKNGSLYFTHDRPSYDLDF